MSYEFKDIVGLPPSNSLFQDDFFIEGQVPGESYTKRFSGAQLRGIEKQERLEYDNILRTRVGLNFDYSLPNLSATNYLAPTVNVFHGMTILDTVLKNLQDQVNDIPTDGAVWGQISGTIEDQEDLIELVNTREPSITQGTPTHFWAGDKSFKQVTYEMLGGTFPHPTGFSNQPPVALSGANVISQITIDNQGHVTGVTSRTLTITDLGLDTSSFVTLNTTQTITAAKVFADPSTISLRYADDTGSTLYTSLDFSLPNQSLTGASRRTGTIAMPSLPESYTWTLPTKTGTFAMVSDIPTVPDLTGYVTKDGVETITGLKTFKNDGGLLIKNTAGTVKALKIGVTSTTSEYIGELRYDTIWGNRVWLLPDATGVIALTSDITSLTKASGVDIDTGTDDVKYITPLSIRNSNILSIEKTGQINGMTNKATPVDADSFIIDDSAASYTKKRMLWSSILTTLDNRYFGNTANQYAAITEKTIIVANDRFVIEDSSNSYAKRMLKWSSIRTVLDNVYYGAVANQFYATIEKTSLSSNDRFVIEDSDATYNKRSVKWNTIVTAIGGGGGATNLDSLTDVTITSVSTGQVLQYNGSKWVNATVSGTSHDRLHTMTNSLDHSMGSGKIIGRITSGTGQPEELSSANVLSFIGVSEAEWKNENITKTHIEAKLTGIITSHTHNYDNYGGWNVSVVGISGTQSISSGGTLTFIGAGGTSISRSGSTITITSSTASGGIPEIPSGTNLNYFRSRDSVGNAAWVLYSAPSTHSAATLSGTISYLTLNSSTQVFTASKVPILDINATGTPSNTTYLRGDGQWATPPGTNYTFSNSILNTSGTVTLVNDSTTPGNSKYYGTNSSGTKGWYDYSAGSISTYSWNLQAGSNPVAEIVTGNTVQFTIGIGLGLLYTDSGLGTYTLAYGLNASINNLNDVEITTPISNQILRYNGTGWVNSADTALSWGNHAAAGYLESLTTDGTNNGITIEGTSTNPTLKIVSINQAGIGQITVIGSTIGVTLGITDTTAAAGNHSHTQLHDRSHAITSTNDHTATAHRLFYSNASGQVVELAFGTNKQLLMSNGASSAPSFVNLSSLDAFTYGSKGLVPAPSTTEAATETRFLCADGSWSIPTGTGTGMTNPMTTTGDIIYRSSSQSATRLGIGSVNQVLSVSSTGIPEWKTLASTFVMNITGDIVAGTDQVAKLQNSAVAGKPLITSLDASDLFLVSQDDTLKSITAGNIQKYIVPFTSKGQLLYGGESGAVAVLPANITTTRTILSQVSSNTSWIAHTFNNLNDTAVYGYGNSLNLVRVNGSGTGLEYMSVAVTSASALRIDGTVLVAKLQNESFPTLGGPLNANSNNISLSGNIIPVVDGSTSLKDIGSSSAYWKDIYSKGKIYLAGGTTFYAGDINGSAYFNNTSAGVVTARTNFVLGLWKFELADSGNTMRLIHNNIIRFEFYSTGDMKFFV